MKTMVNTVPAENQMVNSDVLSFLGDSKAPLRILVLGNSITRHGPCEPIGWHFDWGMAASAPEKDFVHRLYDMLRESGKDVYMMIRQASRWERNFKNPDCLAEYENEKAFGADIVIFRLGENVVKEDFPELKAATERLLNHVTPVGASAILTTGFWKNPVRDRAVAEAAEALGCPCVDVSCSDESMMAIGKFTHHGVSIHPGDMGMEMIARKIFEYIMKSGFAEKLESNVAAI